MAGDWIKVEKATARKPEVLAIAEILQIHPDHAFGLCVRFWFWCDDQLKTCHAKSVTNVTLDYVVGHTGFANALLEVGWLLARNGSLEVPNFDRHLSESAKKRADSLRRKQKQRDSERHKTVTQFCDKSHTREEKEKENNPKAPLVDGWIIPDCLKSELGTQLIDRYVLIQKNKGRHDPVAFQTTLGHLASYPPRKALGLLAEWIEAGRFKPSYEVNWEPYAPSESAIPVSRPNVRFNREPRL